MDSIYKELISWINRSEFPHYLIPKIQALGVNGFQIEGYGSPAFTNVEAGAIYYEFAKKDASISTFVLVHNSVGSSTVNILGDQAQKDRLLPETINMDKIISFALTEPNNGSDASGLKTTATKVEGGYLINGHKRWIGSATFADYILVWAKNKDEANNVQCFIVTKGSAGISMSKMENKMAMRVNQNGDFTMKDVFVPIHNKLTHAKNFATGTNAILEKSRLGVAWMIAGIGAGAYEAALKYSLERKQFGKPIAQFQLTQEKLSRMLAYVELSLSHLLLLSQKMD